jgi:tetratricopeptide (TPR) repeat protein
MNVAGDVPAFVVAWFTPRGNHLTSPAFIWEFSKAGQKEQALDVVDEALAEAIHENRGTWALILCRHASVLAHSMGDHPRQIQYEERALPFAKEYRFAAYNFAQLLLKQGQVARAEQYANEVFKLSITGTTDADRDLVAAILKQWPNISQDQ